MSVFNAESHISRMHTDIAHCTGCARSSFCGFHWNLNLALAHPAFVHAKLSSIGSTVFEHGELPGWWRVRQQKVQLWKYHSRSLLTNSNRRMFYHMISIRFSFNYTSSASHEISKSEGPLTGRPFEITTISSVRVGSRKYLFNTNRELESHVITRAHSCFSLRRMGNSAFFRFAFRSCSHNVLFTNLWGTLASWWI